MSAISRSSTTGSESVRRRRAGILRGACAVAAALVVLCLSALPGEADVIDGAITSITTEANQTQQGDRVDLRCTWAVPDGSAPGDTFTLQLPPELKWFGSSDFALRAPTGETAVTAHADGAGLVTFTLTDYVLTHPVQLHGDCTFSTVYLVVATGGEVTVEFTVGSQVVPVVIETGEPCTGACGSDHTEADKDSWWSDGTQQSVESRIEAPPTTADLSTVTLTDTPGAGLALDCSTLTTRIGTQLDADGHVGQPLDDDLYPAQVTCTPAHLSVTWVDVPPGEYTELRVRSIVTDPALDRYANAGTVTINGIDTPVETVIRRTDGGGSAIGTPAPTTTTTIPTTTATPTTTAAPTSTPTTAPTTAPPSATAPTASATAPPTAPATVSVPGGGTTAGQQVTPNLALTGTPARSMVAAGLALLILGCTAVFATRTTATQPSGDESEIPDSRSEM